MDNISKTLSTTAMQRMRELHYVKNPPVNSWLFIHRLDKDTRKILWNNMKQTINKLPANFSEEIRKRTEEGAVKIHYKSTAGTSYEYTFLIDGWDCCLVYKKFMKKKEEAYYEMFNPHDGTYYKRNLLELDMEFL